MVKGTFAAQDQSSHHKITLRQLSQALAATFVQKTDARSGGTDTLWQHSHHFCLPVPVTALGPRWILGPSLRINNSQQSEGRASCETFKATHRGSAFFNEDLARLSIFFCFVDTSESCLVQAACSPQSSSRCCLADTRGYFHVGVDLQTPSQFFLSFIVADNGRRLCINTSEALDGLFLEALWISLATYWFLLLHERITRADSYLH